MRQIPILLLVLVASIQAQSPPEPADLTELRQSWKRAVSQATAPLDRKYADALQQMKTRYTKEGKLHEALTVDNELKLLTSRESTQQGTGTNTSDRVRHQWSLGAKSDFNTARKLAETEGKRLPMLKTEDDQKSFMKFMSTLLPKPVAWLDARFDEASLTWVWGDGTPLTYTNWADKQPNITTGAVIQISGTDGTWGSTTPGRVIDTVLDDPK
jgi:hypothetical protein